MSRTEVDNVDRNIEPKYPSNEQNQNLWMPSDSFDDDKSCSSMSDAEYHDENEYPRSSILCGGLCNFVGGMGNAGKCQGDKFQQLQRKTRKSSKKLGYDADSVMPTHRNDYDNESIFLPPSKVYARSYSSDKEDEENEPDGEMHDYALADSLYSDDESNYRHDNHSVATEKFNNTTELRQMQEARAMYAGRMGVDPETMI